MRSFVLLLLAACTGDLVPVLSDDSGDGGGGDGGSGDGGAGDGGAGDGGAGDGGGGDGGAVGELADYCHVQWPCGMTGAPGASSDPVYVWVYEPKLTQGAGAGAGVQVELGVGPDGSDPASDGTWAWTAAAWSADKDGLAAGDLANDEHSGTFLLPAAVGSYDYCGRVSLDGGASWRYCDLAENDGNGCGGAGSDDGYSPAAAGALTVK